MEQNEIRVDKIIDKLNSDWAINSIFDGRIYFWAPTQDDQVWPYLCVNIITTPIVDVAYKMTRLEFRFIANDSNTTFKSLIDAKNTITLFLQSTFDYEGFKAYKVSESGNFFNALDDKKRNIVVQDYFFYFATY